MRTNVSNVCTYVSWMIAFGVASYIFDLIKCSSTSYKTCIRNVDFHIKLLVHHLLFAFILTGWCVDDVRINVLYLCTIWIVMLNWEATGGYCTLTVMLNESCNLPKDSYFHDLFYWVGIKTHPQGDLIYKMFLFFALTVSMWRVWRIWRGCTK